MMNLSRKTYTTRNEKIIDFAIGFVGWIVLGTLLWFAFNFLAALIIQSLGTPRSIQLVENISLAASCIPLVINIGLLIFFAFTRRWIAFGMLAVWGAGLVITLCAGIFIAVLCFGSGALR